MPEKIHPSLLDPAVDPVLEAVLTALQTLVSEGRLSLSQISTIYDSDPSNPFQVDQPLNHQVPTNIQWYRLCAETDVAPDYFEKFLNAPLEQLDPEALDYYRASL